MRSAAGPQVDDGSKTWSVGQFASTRETAASPTAAISTCEVDAFIPWRSLREGGSRRRRGHDVDISWRWRKIGVLPRRLRRGRGYDEPQVLDEMRQLQRDGGARSVAEHGVGARPAQRVFDRIERLLRHGRLCGSPPGVVSERLERRVVASVAGPEPRVGRSVVAEGRVDELEVPIETRERRELLLEERRGRPRAVQACADRGVAMGGAAATTTPEIGPVAVDPSSR